MAINIRNYTSSVSADQSVLNIERKLVEHGASSIMKSYDGDGNIESISFRHKYKDEYRAFKLPAKVESVYRLFLNNKGNRIDKKRLLDQAKRTAWKNVSDWVDLQMTMISLNQVEFNEIFLPYMLVANGEGNGSTTVYNKFKESGLKQLGQ